MKMFSAGLVSTLAALCFVVPAAAGPLATPSADRSNWPVGTLRSNAAVELGRHLFFDPRLVLSEDQSCASCHSPHMGYADGVALDLAAHKGGKQATRNSPTVYNLSEAPVLHWDGRTPDRQCFTAKDTGEDVCLAPLESQAFKSMRSRKIYRGFLPKVQQDEGYRAMFRAAFPPDGAITHVNMARAIAAFERSLVSNDSAFDRYLAGDERALSPEAVRGLALFEGKAQCIACHNGAHFTDWRFHNIGVDSDDPGRGAKVKSD
ncbi:MAG: cytochrome-c peroxidase, partial [Pseudomonadota bacterium]